MGPSRGMPVTGWASVSALPWATGSAEPTASGLAGATAWAVPGPPQPGSPSSPAGRDRRAGDRLAAQDLPGRSRVVLRGEVARRQLRVRQSLDGGVSAQPADDRYRDHLDAFGHRDVHRRPRLDQDPRQRALVEHGVDRSVAEDPGDLPEP